MRRRRDSSVYNTHHSLRITECNETSIVSRLSIECSELPIDTARDGSIHASTHSIDIA